MKVPIQYKSSDRYNAGVDVVYDDDSKLQYAPFIYASTQSGDNGPDEGGDEEGEDDMVLIETTFDSTALMFKSSVTANDVIGMMLQGKCVGFHIPAEESYSIKGGVIMPTSGGYDSQVGKLAFSKDAESGGYALDINSAFVDSDTGLVCFTVFTD